MRCLRGLKYGLVLPSLVDRTRGPCLWSINASLLNEAGRVYKLEHTGREVDLEIMVVVVK